MCGIVGSLSLGKKGYTIEQVKVQHSLLMSSILRGIDGAGIAVGSNKNPRDVLCVKRAKPAPDVFDIGAMILLAKDSRWIIGHCRAATLGGAGDDACHPFEVDDVVGVHNGTIRNMDYRFPSIKGINDSHILYKALAEAVPEEAPDVLKELDPGAYALAWYDKRIESLRFVRNSHRPLWFYRTKTAWWWASEPGILASCIARTDKKNPLAYTDIVPWQLDTHKLLTVPINGEEASVVEYTPEIYNRNSPVYRDNLGVWNQTRVSHSHYLREASDYAGWWADEIDADDPRQTPLTGWNTINITEKEGWISIRGTADLWNGPGWLAPYKVNIYKAMQWLFDLPGGQAIGTSEKEFSHDLMWLASKTGTRDDSKSICFTVFHVNETSGMVYGAVTAGANNTMPVVGLMSTVQLADYLSSFSKVKGGYTDVLPLFEGELVAVNAYCDRTVGVRVDKVSIIGWEPADVISPEEIAHGGADTHPHRLVTKYPDIIDWTNWSR